MELQIIKKILDNLKSQRNSLEDALLTGSVENWEYYKYLTGQYNMLLTIQRDVKDILKRQRYLMTTKKNKSQGNELPDKVLALDNVYRERERQFLDPSQLPTKLIERLPQPTGWRMLILPYMGQAKTKGGIILPDEARDREHYATVCAYVLKVGPDAYKDKEKFPNGPWCKEGDWILFGRYAGARFKLEDGECRIINDDEVIGTIKEPSDIVHV